MKTQPLKIHEFIDSRCPFTRCENARYAKIFDSVNSCAVGRVAWLNGHETPVKNVKINFVKKTTRKTRKTRKRQPHENTQANMDMVTISMAVFMFKVTLLSDFAFSRPC